MPNLFRDHPKDEAYVKRAFPLATDKEMSNHLQISVSLVRQIRSKLGLKRERWDEVGKERIAVILEFFANGKTVRYISQVTNMDVGKINRLIENYWFTKQRSYNTITLVMESKANYYDY